MAGLFYFFVVFVLSLAHLQGDWTRLLFSDFSDSFISWYILIKIINTFLFSIHYKSTKNVLLVFFGKGSVHRVADTDIAEKSLPALLSLESCISPLVLSKTALRKCVLTLI